MKNSVNQPSHPEERRKPRKAYRAFGKLLLTSTLLLGAGNVVNNLTDSMDTSHHSTEVKLDLQETLKPATEKLGQKLLNFANSKKRNSDYSVSVFNYESDNMELLSDTTISTNVISDTFEVNEQFTVTVNNSGEFVGISGSNDSYIDGNTIAADGFSISAPTINMSNEWTATARLDGSRLNTGDQGLTVGMYGDKRSDIERADDIARQAEDMIITFTENP